ncbi:putative pci domain-containing protein [Erysiphe necator]|uniref:Putative pci domain-containing protein n=1 Tax=Uncinula necator TaxID=52586 RepID=A0A0B1P3R8_UNCNE|nr:putative pci domain-containing protein [Erysiphe necator]
MLLSFTTACGLFAGYVIAQSMNNSIPFNPATVSPTLRAQWCQGQTNTCGTLCSGNLKENDCDPDTLNYSCHCGANNSSPGLQYYKETMPTFICEMVFDNCIKAGENSQAAQALCTENEKRDCGHLSPEDFVGVAPTSSSAPPSPTTTGGVATSSAASGAAVTNISPRNIETGALAIGIIAALALLP